MGGMLNVGALAMDQGEWELLTSIGVPGQCGVRATGYRVALLRSTNFFTFFCPSQTLTLLAMSTNSRSTW